MMKRRVIWFVAQVCVVLMVLTGQAFASQTMAVPVADDNEIAVERFSADGEYLMLWFAPEYGLRENHRSVIRQISSTGIEIWLSDIADSLFMPPGSSSLKQLKGNYVADMIEYAHQHTGKRVVVSGDSYATLVALSGARAWQQRGHSKDYFIGAVLFSPYTYTHIPQLGELPQYMPIISASNTPMMVYQAKHSAIFGQFNSLIENLQQHNNAVYTQMIPGVMSLFYQSEPTPEMRTQAKKVANGVKKMIALIDKHEVPKSVIPIRDTRVTKSGIDLFLRKFTANRSPIEIDLKDVHGRSFKRNSFTGRVSIINFWATWCPPCVEEIPSLNKLKNAMPSDSFELISINYAESPAQIIQFMKEVNVDFPVLVDEEGNFAQQWNVISFPSTFIIDSGGIIRYGVNGAIDWGDPKLIKILKELI